MPRQPRALGYFAHQQLVALEVHLATADRLLEPQSRGEPVRYELIAIRSRLEVAEARRLLEKTLALGAGPQPQEER